MIYMKFFIFIIWRMPVKTKPSAFNMLASIYLSNTINYLYKIKLAHETLKVRIYF